MAKMAKARNRVSFSLLLIFVSAVLVPSIALSFLALRAADRESVYVERRLEGALLAEVDLAARRVEELTNDIFADLREDVFRPWIDPVTWSESNPMVGVPFTLQNGRLIVSSASPAAEAAFRASFGAFLQDGSRLPVYDSIARVYRKEMQDFSHPHPQELSWEPPDLTGRLTRSRMEPVPTPAAPFAKDIVTQAETSAPAKIARPSVSAPSAAPRRQPVKGVERQANESRIATSPEVREDAFRQVSKKGFEISQRNVAQQSPSVLAEAERDERSKTVSQSRTFGELLNEASSGLLPHLSDRGLEILFWTRRADGEILGCTLRMDTLRERIADVLPDVLSGIRILTVLDDAGNPLVVPDLSGVSVKPEWRRPFVAREISPVLPRWEAAAWLTDPAAPASRARFATLAVWVLVATLFLVIAVGSAVVLRMLSAEMRLAGQKTTFVANVSHELKTPLTSIRLFAELLLSGKQADEHRRREYLRTMMSEAERLSRLVDNVLAFSKRGKNGHVAQPLRLDALTRETVEQLEPHLSKNGFLIDVSCAEPLTVRGNREELRQVVMNLLSNAEKYSGETREISVRCRRDGELAVVEVADRGIGVEPKFADKIFQEFFRIDDSLSAPRSGAGLGLAIARDIARRHGGDIRYRPRPGGGSIFTLFLPGSRTLGPDAASRGA